MMEDKSSIYENYGLEIEYKRDKIGKNVKEENEFTNLEESDEAEKSIIVEKRPIKKK